MAVRELSGSNQNYLYSTNYDYWKNSLPSLIADYQKRLKSVSGRQIVDYKKITEGVYQTVYDNDISVIVNFNNEEFEFNNVKIKPNDFILKGVS